MMIDDDDEPASSEVEASAYDVVDIFRFYARDRIPSINMAAG
jgi:hypothetical protein